MIFFRIHIFDEVCVYELQAIYSMKWDDFSEDEECHKTSKTIN